MLSSLLFSRIFKATAVFDCPAFCSSYITGFETGSTFLFYVLS